MNTIQRFWLRLTQRTRFLINYVAKLLKSEDYKIISECSRLWGMGEDEAVLMPLCQAIKAKCGFRFFTPLAHYENSKNLVYPPHLRAPYLDLWLAQIGQDPQTNGWISHFTKNDYYLSSPQGTQFIPTFPFKQILIIPIWSWGSTRAILGFWVFGNDERRWTNATVETLKVLAEIYSSYLWRRSAELEAIRNSKLSALGEIAAGIAHEINNPLAIVHGKAYMIQSQLDSVASFPGDKVFNEESFKDLSTNCQDIISTIQRMDKIITSLRYFIRDDSRNPFMAVEVNEILESVQMLCINRCQKAGIEVRVNKNFKELDIQCKPVQISQVLVNLVNNAFDVLYNCSGPKWIQLDSWTDNEKIFFSVTDAGSGIKPEVGEMILKSFYTTKVTTRTSGSGWGLNISKRIIESHGGGIFIDYDSPNTKFVVEMPQVQVVDIKGDS